MEYIHASYGAVNDVGFCWGTTIMHDVAFTKYECIEHCLFWFLEEIKTAKNLGPVGCGRGGRNKDSTQALMAKTVIIIIIIFPQATGQKFGNVRVPGCVAPHEAMAGGFEQVLVCVRER